MDYKYIEQLLERYWQCETSLQEEEILRAFFAQEDVPVWLAKYKAFFTSNSLKQNTDVLGDEFDVRMMELIDGPTPVKARTISMTQRLMPLFKVAAVVAILLTLGNAAQTPWDRGWDDPREAYAKHQQELLDSVNMEPMQAENIIDTVQVITPEATATQPASQVSTPTY